MMGLSQEKLAEKSRSIKAGHHKMGERLGIPLNWKKTRLIK